MSNANKRKGSLAESRHREWLRDQGLSVDHLRLSGAEDIGDLYIREWDAVAEVKNEKRINLSGYMKEAQVEAENYAKAHRRGKDRPAALTIVKARAKGIDQSYVVMTLAEFAELMKRHG